LAASSDPRGTSRGTIDCVATGSDGLEYPARIVLTDVTDTGYDIDVTMGATPLA
jgi:hypothetical protein